MSDFTKAFNLLVQAGNGVQTITTFNTPLGLSVVQRILITFPPGCSSLVGMAILAGMSPAYPVQANTFLAFDDYTYEQEVSGQIQSGQWSVQAFNTDFNQHTLQVVFEANYLTFAPNLAPFQPLSL